MVNITKHIGFNTSTTSRLGIIFMQLPEDKETALVVEIDALPDLIKNTFLDCLNSVNGQQSQNLADALSREYFSETKQTILQTLHSRNLMHRESIDNITMRPNSDTTFPLRIILQQMGKVDGTPEEAKSQYQKRQSEMATADQKKLAVGYIKQAEMLEEEARLKRIEAYKIDMSLMPVAPLERAPQSVPSAEINIDAESQTDSVHPFVEVGQSRPQI